MLGEELEAKFDQLEAEPDVYDRCVACHQPKTPGGVLVRCDASQQFKTFPPRWVSAAVRTLGDG